MVEIKRWVGFIVWYVCVTTCLSFSIISLSQPDLVLNVLGAGVGILAIWVSYYTNCFMKFFERKIEDDRIKSDIDY